MFLKSLEIQGFKSFPDRLKLEFPHGITAVVGPNGSGKSNIADAVRWVLGEQSTKSLRGQKMEDVIFTGTSRRGAMGFAEVTLHLDNTDRELPVDADEVTVGRKLYRSGESEYRLGGSAVRLREIHELLMDTGLGRDGYCIVGQGRITEIISQKSADRREIFEEAAGISKYRYRKEEAERRLDAAEENLVRLRDILAELESRVEPLRREADKAERFLALAADRRQLEISLWVASLAELMGSIAAESDKLLVARTDYEHAKAQADAIQAQIEEAYQAMNRCAAEVDRLQAERAQVEEQLGGCASEIAVLENDLGHGEETMARLRGEIGQSGDSAEALDRQAAEKQAEAAGIAAERQRRADTLAERERALETAQGERRQLGDRIDRLTAELGRRSVELSRLGAVIETGAAAVAELEGRIAAAAGQAEADARQLESLRQEKRENDEALAAIDEQTAIKRNERVGYALRMQIRSARRDAAEAEMREISLEIDRKRQRARVLYDLEKNMEGLGGAVKAVMQAAAHGELRGILGPVSQLIRVEDRLALAIETALGGALQHIVTESEDASKRAIGWLKNHKAGRATFLPLPTIKARPLQERGLEDRMGFVGVADRLVAADERYRAILSSLLGRTVIVEELDDATAMARQYGYRFRIVTLDGQVVNTGGSLTGGSSVRSAGILSRRGEADRMTAEAEALERQYREKEAAFRQIAAEVSQLEGTMLALQGEMTALSEDRIRLDAEGKRLEQQAAELERQMARAEEEGKTLAARLEESRRSRSEAAVRMTEAAAEAERLEGEIAALSGDRDRSRELRDRITAELGEMRLRVMALEKDLGAAHAAAAELIARKDAMGQQRETLESQLREAEAHQAELRARIEALTLRRRSLENRTGAIAAGIEAAQKERASREAQATGLRGEERAGAERRESLSREVVRLEERTRAIQADYDSIIGKLWDEYELTRSGAEAVAQPVEDRRAASKQLGEIKSKIKALGSVHVGAIEEYREVNERYQYLQGQIEDVERSKAELGRMIGDLTATMREQFTGAFEAIAARFSVIFTELFGGGRGELSLGEGDVLECGIDIRVAPPGKIIKSLQALSGGEQSFVAIAIYLAILQVRPAPFCILDEIEAALDDINVVKYADYLGRMTDRTQFILITHRRGTMEAADLLYGVTMQEEGVSKILEMPISEIEHNMQPHS